MISWSHQVLSLLTASVIVAAAAAHGLEPSTPLARLSRQSWSVENGLPQNTAPVLMQARSGYLYVGTEIGLARFDGAAFEVLDHTYFKFPSDAEIHCLLDAKDLNGQSSPWIGTEDGLVHWKEGASTLYTTADGLPSNAVHNLTQTADGTLWVLTQQGLARLVGNGFAKVTVPEIASLGALQSFAAGNGDLWLSGSNGVAVFRSPRWQRDSRVLGSSEGGALVAPAADGSVLISTNEGVFLQAGKLLKQVINKSSLPQGSVSFLARLADGSIAAASKSVLVLVKNDGGSFTDQQRLTVARDLPGTRIETIYPDREGALWVGTNHGLARMTETFHGISVQVLPPTDPLAVDAAVSMLEDREGDLWVGSETTGLHVLRDARFRMIGLSDGLSSDDTTAVVQDARGALWIGTRENGLNRIAPDSSMLSALSIAAKGLRSRSGSLAPYDKGMTNLTSANGLLSDVILSLAAAPNGDVWVGTPDGLNRISGATGSIVSFTSADGLPDDFIRSLLVEPDGSLWIGTRRGLTHLDLPTNSANRPALHVPTLHVSALHIIDTLTQSDGLGSDLVGALARSADGDLWIATLNGLSRLHEDTHHHSQIRTYTTADGLSSNIITALDITGDGMVWIGTQGNGLNLWDGTRFRQPPQAAHPPVAVDGATPPVIFPSVIHAILHDGRGHVWLASDHGLTRADHADLLSCVEKSQCASMSSHLVDFTTADGLRSRETSSNSHPTAVRLRDGELWFATPRGVAIVDPDHFAPMPAAPPVAIERFAVDDHILGQVADEQSTQPVRIAAGHLRFQFDYIGLSFAAPQKLRYEYMLEGFDHGWTDAGTRRTAYYTNIPPGPYRFLVRAKFGQGNSNAPGTLSDGVSQASLKFQLLPHLYQTWWFRGLFVLVLASLVVLVFRRRVIRVRRELGVVMSERNRIAREIHDTLAQGYVGISLQLEMLGELLRHGRSEAAGKLLASTQGLVREGLEDARQSIWALRSHDAGEHTLPVHLRRLVEKAQSSDLTAELEVHGAYRALESQSESEILRIAQEAIQNVKRHSHASHMSVRLDYGERELQLTVTDDGRGFTIAKKSKKATSTVRGNRNYKQAAIETDAVNNGRHFGLTGMQERAALIGAEIDIFSAPGQGTRVTVSVSAPEVPTRPESDAVTMSKDDETQREQKSRTRE